MAILICSATQSELDACYKGISTQAKGADQFSYLKCGIGVDKSRARLHRFLEKRKRRKQPPPKIIISTGFAGAISSELLIGDGVISDSAHWLFTHEKRSSQVSERGQARFIRSHKDSKSLVESLSKKLKPSARKIYFGPLISGGTFFEHNMIQKMNLWELKPTLSEPLAYDMETAALFCEASCWSIPYFSLRVISDTEQKPLPKFVADFSNALASTSYFNAMRLAATGFRDLFPHPVKEISSLYRQGTAATRFLTVHWEQVTPTLLKLLKSQKPNSLGLTL